MPQYSFLSFAADNISNPNGAGGIPEEQQGVAICQTSQLVMK